MRQFLFDQQTLIGAILTLAAVVTKEMARKRSGCRARRCWSALSLKATVAKRDQQQGVVQIIERRNK
ncbi:hypothetical protein [Sinorhizobium meliloti]|uniref:hypothetical protein n=1 Tax=Rhizobium meliloti TaxID=382 RepID=UPI000FDB2AFA|nr:hypothetical protein [Sinorhizobium meliloti]RVH24509.1 hypothetical protein CN215_17680 [Sinorhizobium meliloti]